MRKKTKTVLLLAAVFLLLAILGFALWQLFSAQADYRLEAEAHDALLPYRPAPGQGAANLPEIDPGETGAAPPTPEAPFRNETIVRLREDHPNALGWLSVPGTEIEYPFVQGPDNDYFLRRDVDGNDLYAGVPFLDYRCAPDCSGDNTIIYGHNLRNGTMFGDLENFQKRDYFDEHREILVYLEDRTIRAEIVACLVVDPEEKDYVYRVQPEADHLDRLLADARQSLPRTFEAGQRFLTLSTCGYSFQGARIVLVGLIDG